MRLVSGVNRSLARQESRFNSQLAALDQSLDKTLERQLSKIREDQARMRSTVDAVVKFARLSGAVLTLFAAYRGFMVSGGAPAFPDTPRIVVNAAGWWLIAVVAGIGGGALWLWFMFLLKTKRSWFPDQSSASQAAPDQANVNQGIVAEQS